jgi:hypothetical protein
MKAMKMLIRPWPFKATPNVKDPVIFDCRVLYVKQTDDNGRFYKLLKLITDTEPAYAMSGTGV